MRVNQSNAKMSAVPTIISLMSAACAFPGQFTDRQVVLLQLKQQPMVLDHAYHRKSQESH